MIDLGLIGDVGWDAVGSWIILVLVLVLVDDGRGEDGLYRELGLGYSLLPAGSIEGFEARVSAPVWVWLSGLCFYSRV